MAQNNRMHLLLLLPLLLLPSCSCSCSWQEATPSCIANQFDVDQAEVESLLASLEQVDRQGDWLRAVLQPKRALLVIDMQLDFINGSLAVGGAGAIVRPIQQLVWKEELWEQVIFSADWHPSDHISFFSNLGLRTLDPEWRAGHPGDITMFQEVVFARSPPYSQVLWPDHCVQNSTGATFHPSISLPPMAKLVRKGTNPEVDSYSAFFDNTGTAGAGSTGLAEMVANSTEVVVVGLATDYCVGSTALHALQQGLPTTLLSDLARPVAPEGGAAMEERVQVAGGWVDVEASWQESLDTWERARMLGDFWLKNSSNLKIQDLGALLMGLLVFLCFHEI